MVEFEYKGCIYIFPMYSGRNPQTKEEKESLLKDRGRIVVVPDEDNESANIDLPYLYGLHVSDLAY